MGRTKRIAELVHFSTSLKRCMPFLLKWHAQDTSIAASKPNLSVVDSVCVSLCLLKRTLSVYHTLLLAVHLLVWVSVEGRVVLVHVLVERRVAVDHTFRAKMLFSCQNLLCATGNTAGTGGKDGRFRLERGGRRYPSRCGEARASGREAIGSANGESRRIPRYMEGDRAS